MRNHYIPQFYLRTWYCKNEEKIFVYTRDPKKNLRLDLRPSKSIGYQTDLYSMEPDGLLALGQKDDTLETLFFQEIDNTAAKVHEKISSCGINSLNEHDRDVWSKFIEALLERSPRRINEIISKTTSEIEVEILNKIQQFNSEEYKETAKKIIANSNFPQAVKNGALWAMQKTIEDGELAKGIREYEWLTIDHKKETEHFLTSDNPLLINNGTNADIAWCISIAISPKRLLVMMARRSEFDEDFVFRLAATHSIQMCRQADKYLISSRHLEKSDITNYKSAASDLFDIEKP